MSAASKKKGLSIEEKVAKTEEWFQEHPHPYPLKELLLLIPKAKGVIPQSLEECLEQLVSEGRVQSDRLGVTVMYWKFHVSPTANKSSTSSSGKGGSSSAPSGSGQNSFLKQKIAKMNLPELTAAVETLQKEHDALVAQVEQRSEVVETDASKLQTDALLRQLQEDERRLQLECAPLAAFDPQLTPKLLASIRIAVAEVNRLTDDLFLIEQYCKKRCGWSTKDFRQQFQLPAQLDYVELV